MEMEMEMAMDMEENRPGVENNSTTATIPEKIFLANTDNTNQTISPTTSTTTIHPSSPTNNNNNNKAIDSSCTNLITRSPLFYSFGWDGTRGSITTLCSPLEINNNSQVAFISDRRGISHSMDINSLTLVQQQVNIIGTGTCGKYFFELRNYRGVTGSRLTISIYFICCTGTKQATTSLGLQKHQQVYSMSAFQDGRSTSSEGNYQPGRLDMQIGSQGCLCGSTNTQGFKKISLFQAPRQDLSLQVPSLWNECGPSGVLEANEVCNGSNQATRDTTGLLPRRHLYFGDNTTATDTTNKDSDATFGKIGVHYQREEKRFDTKKESGLSRLQLQYEQHDNQGAGEENAEITVENQTSIQHQIMSMDSGIIGEDYQHVTSNRGCITPHTLPAEGFGKESQGSALQLGKDVPSNDISKTRTGLVDDNGQQEEWIEYQDNIETTTSGHDLGRCQRQWMGHQISKDGNIWTLVGGRKRYINQCEGIEDDTICDTTTQKRLCQSNDRNTKRQHHSNQIRQQARRDSLTNSTIHSFGNQFITHPTQYHSILPPHSGDRQHYSRCPEQTNTNIRMETSSTSISPNMSSLALLPNNRRFCDKTELPTSYVLELPTRPSSTPDRCISTNLASNRTVYVPALAIDPSSSTAVQAAASQEGNVGDPILADATLVAHGDGTSNQRTYQDQVVENENPGRMVIIQKAYEKWGLRRGAQTYVMQTTRPSTSYQYDKSWDRWWKWCKQQSPKKDPMVYDPNLVTEWLTENKTLAQSTLNSWRTGVASVWDIWHRNEQNLADTPPVKAFFKAHKRKQPVVKQKKDEVWDVKVMVNYIRSWGANQDMDLEKLQLKVIMLLCLVTFGRPRSDIGRLQHGDIEWLYNTDDNNNTLNGVRLLMRQPKEATQKYTTISVIPDQPNMCAVLSLRLFVEKTAPLRTHLTSDHTLFLAYIINPTKQPGNISPKTVAQKLKTLMQQAGIDTATYTAHSIRSASATAAHQAGIKRRDIKKHGNWSLKSDTLEKYYLRSSGKLRKSRRIARKVILE
jgi:hypothetical protein